jgi:hypothetical protein
MTSKQKVAIFVPKGLRTGGPEAMHQLHLSLVEEGINSVLIPWPGTRNNEEISEYIKYQPQWVKISSVRKNDIVVVPSDLGYLPIWYFLFVSKKYLYLWMLAVDFSFEKKFSKYESRNYKIHSEWKLANKRGKLLEFFSKIKNLNYTKYRKRLCKIRIRIQKSNYLFQSAYSREIFKIKHNSTLGMMLSDYVVVGTIANFNLSSFCECSKKHIAYSPAKSQDLMKLILDINLKDKNFHFTEIKNLNIEQVTLILSKADLYLDLGYFPGKDRLPREAILLNCPVMLAKRGSARYHEDFPLENLYLLDLELLNPIRTYIAIKKVLSYGKKFNLESQSKFKSTVMQEKQIFRSEVKEFISQINNIN